MKAKTILSWSGGKDSAWALHALRGDPTVEMIGLLCVTDHANDVVMHSTSLDVIRAQAKAAGLPLFEVGLPSECGDEAYSSIMAQTCVFLQEAGAARIAFGDIYLQSVRDYRERSLAGTQLQPYFPLWKFASPRDIALHIVSGGVRAKVCSINTSAIDRQWLGADFDLPFLQALPPDVDWLGESGDFHTVVYEGPMFSKRLTLRRCETRTVDHWSSLRFDINHGE